MSASEVRVSGRLLRSINNQAFSVTSGLALD